MRYSTSVLWPTIIVLLIAGPRLLVTILVAGIILTGALLLVAAFGRE